VRADARRRRRASDDGANAGAEHAAVLMGPHQAAPSSSAGAADLPARGRRAGRAVRCAPPPPRDLRGRFDGRHHTWQQGRRRHRRPLPRPHRNRRAADRRAGQRRPSRQPVRARRPRSRLRHPRRVRRPLEEPQLAAVGGPPPTSAGVGSRGGTGRRRRAGQTLRPVPGNAERGAWHHRVHPASRVGSVVGAAPGAAWGGVRPRSGVRPPSYSRGSGAGQRGMRCRAPSSRDRATPVFHLGESGPEPALPEVRVPLSRAARAT
jgi:hypothetical protein